MLGEDISYNVYLPAGYDSTAKHYPVLYLLHGRGDSMAAWTQVKGKLDAMIADGRIPATIAIMPDAPWSSRASYYVDSAYRGADPGRNVETAFTTDLIQHVDTTYRTIPSRDGRVVGGYSMGGYGAIRYSIAHPDLFAASIVLSPAVYFPLPPSDSSTREFGAFGQGRSLFADAVYLKLNYPVELPRFSAKNLPSHMFIAVGDDEYQNPKTDGLHARPRFRVAHPLQVGRAHVAPLGRASRSERRPRLGCAGHLPSRKARSTPSSTSRGPRSRS